MRRRELLLAAAAGGFLSRRAGAQPPPRSARIGWLTAQRPASLVPFVQAFRTSLADLGFVEGRNLTIDFRYADDDASKVAGLADELVRLPVELIVVQGEAVLEIKSLSLPVPVVYAYSADPVIAGLAESLARPNPNMTGLTYMAVELNGKRLELLREMAPSIRRVALLANPAYPGEERRARQFRGDRRPHRLRRSLCRRAHRRRAEGGVREDGRRQGAGDLAARRQLHGAEPRAASWRSRAEQRIPVVSSWPVFAEAGALCTHGPRLADSYRASPTTPIASCAAPSRPTCRSSSRRRSRRSSTSRLPTPSA